MLLYVSWILQSATRDARRQRLFRQALQQTQLHEVISEPTNNVLSNVKAPSSVAVPSNQEQLKLNHASEQLKNDKFTEKGHTDAHISSKEKNILNNSPLAIVKLTKNDNLEKNVKNVNTKKMVDINYNKSNVSNLINDNKVVKNKTHYKNNCGKLKCDVEPTNLIIGESGVKCLKNKINESTLVIIHEDTKKVNEEIPVDPIKNNEVPQEQPVSKYRSRLKKPELVKVHASMRPTPQSLGRSYSIA